MLSTAISFEELGIDRFTVNGELRSPDNKFVEDLLGRPRRLFDQKCRRPTLAPVRNLVKKSDVGPFQVEGLAPAVTTLEDVFQTISRHEPDVYAVLGSAGMLCCRYMRGTDEHLSNHAWGLAIDLRVEEKLDTPGDNLVQLGLARIYRYFVDAGFIWGASFPIEDSMHFEASEQLLAYWARCGHI